MLSFAVRDWVCFSCALVGQYGVTRRFPPSHPGLTDPVSPTPHRVSNREFVKRMTTQQKKNSPARQGFKTGEAIVYPAHGVGTITAIEEQEVAGMKLELFVIDFEKDKMRLKVPVAKAVSIGMRKLSETDFVERALKVVQGKARIKRTMWSRRAQEYDAKINSGDLISIAEVVRDLYRAENQPEQSYSERQLYEQALDRMAREVAAIERIDRDAAIGILNKSLIKAVAA